MNGQENIEEIRSMFNSKLLHDAMNDIEKENDVVILETCEMVEEYLETRPSIEVGKRVKTIVETPKRRNESQFAISTGESSMKLER
jgi:glutamyl-tRNA reductase